MREQITKDPMSRDEYRGKNNTAAQGQVSGRLTGVLAGGPVPTISSDLTQALNSLDQVEDRVAEIRSRVAGLPRSPQCGGEISAEEPSVTFLAGRVRNRIDGLFSIIADIEGAIG